ncbi:winged helix-turn-helix domain-containing protein [Paenirhodobacter populi]|uniref:Myb-like domain-containing protein n=1 Tax=Paenirhodobacter populi TaxID=2306993 RepID=A0A443JEI3_9RHOB|nr:winged helix-turn-helix domain-containing protein [Sinirhodobacter populi]RWR18783.1 hypothetical protein D2T30_15585 [Sinirhodobacter populi]
MTIRADIMALPPQDRLPAALAVIGDLTGEENGMAAAYRELGLSPTQARIAAYLTRKSPGVVPFDAITLVAGGIASDPMFPDTAKTHVHNLRRKLPPAIRVVTVWGEGYRIEGEFPKPVKTPPVQIPADIRREIPTFGRTGQRWTPEDDATLAEMCASGSAWWAIADELERSERAVRDRWRAIGNPHPS